MNIKLINEGMKGVCRQYKVENAEFITVVLVKEDIMIDEMFAAFDTNDGKMVELSCPMMATALRQASISWTATCMMRTSKGT